MKNDCQRFCYALSCYVNIGTLVASDVDVSILMEPQVHAQLMNHLCEPAYICNAIYVVIYSKDSSTAERKNFPGINSADNQCCCTSTRHSQAVALTSAYLEAGVVEFAHVELHPDDGKHDNGEEKQQADLKQRYHGFHYGLQHHLET